MRRSGELVRRLGLRLGIGWGLGAITLAALSLGCVTDRSESSPEKRPNVLLVVADTLRADEVVLEGKRDPTPHLRALAEEGAAFTTAYAHTATTTPSHATLFTSLLPTTHGVTRNGITLQPRHRTLAEVLGEAGYQTAAIVSGIPVARIFGVLQGFEYIDDEIRVDRESAERRPCRASPLERCGEQTNERVLRWLADGRDPRRPFFLFVHYYDPHARYVPPEGFRAPSEAAPAKRGPGDGCRDGRAHYRGEVAFTDHLIGRITAELARLRVADDTLLIVTSDHGESFHEHENCQHSGDLYEELVRIPLLVRWPKRIAPGWRSSHPVGLVDVMPTVLDLVGLLDREPGLAGLQGRSLAAPLLGEEDGVEPAPVFFVRTNFEKRRLLQGHVRHGTQFGVRDGRWKYMEAPDENSRSLYDLEADPAETGNLVADRPAEAARLAAKLAEWRKRAEAARPEWVAEKRVKEKKVVEGLRKLGYVE